MGLGLALTARAAAPQPSLPSAFKTQTITTPDGRGHLRAIRRHGTGGRAAPRLRRHRRHVGPARGGADEAPTPSIVPDLRGMGRSSHPAGGYDKKTQAADIRAVVTALGHDRAAVVAHDIGNMVAYAYAAPLPGQRRSTGGDGRADPRHRPWDEIIRNPALWHFSFGGPDAERLVAGRERIFLDRFWNEFSADPSKIDEATRAHYAALYAQPGAMRAGFAQFAAFSKDAEDNRASQSTKLTMPVLAVGGEKSFGPVMAVNMRNVATDVREAIVPGAGHWLMEENTAYTVAPGARLPRRAPSGCRRASHRPRRVRVLGRPRRRGTGTSAATRDPDCRAQGRSQSLRPLHDHAPRPREHHDRRP